MGPEQLRLLLLSVLRDSNFTNSTGNSAWDLNACPLWHRGGRGFPPGQNEADNEEYDSRGAMIFAVATILFYAMSIVIMIGANLGKSIADDEVKSFLKSYTKLDFRKCEKNMVETALQKKSLTEDPESAPVTPETEVTRRDYKMTTDHGRKFFTFPIREESFDMEDEYSSSPSVT